jgi:plastocyanin
MRLAGAAAALLLAGCSAGARPAAPAGAAAGDVRGDAFSPATLTVPAGTVVTWTEQDDDLDGVGAHSVVADDGSFASAGPVAKGTAFSAKPPGPGTYPYHCGIHNYMTGTITVT